MMLKAKEKEVTLKFKIKDIIKLTDEFKKNNLQELFFEGIQKSNLKVLVKVINTFSYIEDEKAFKTEDQAQSFLDDYIVENNTTFSELYDALAKEINESGFFTKKMSEEELKTQTQSSLDIDVDKMVNSMVEEIAKEEMKPILQEEFKGFKA